MPDGAVSLLREQAKDEPRIRAAMTSANKLRGMLYFTEKWVGLMKGK
jgi:hypothetical protein